MNIALIACCLFVLQTILSFIQITYYKRHMQKMVNQYSGCVGYNLYSAIERKRLGRGVIALIVVDELGVIKECQVLKGLSIFSRFKDLTQFRNQNISKIISQLTKEETLRTLFLWEKAVIKAANKLTI